MALQKTYWKSIDCFSPHCSTKLSPALYKAAINIQAIAIKAGYAIGKLKEGAVIEGAELQFSLSVSVAKYFKEICPLNSKKNENLSIAHNLIYFFGVFHSCLEETSNMVRIYPLITKCFSKEGYGWLLQVSVVPQSCRC